MDESDAIVLSPDTGRSRRAPTDLDGGGEPAGPEPRRSHGLLVFTAVLVALTSGVVLGQTDAYQPPTRTQAAAVPAAGLAAPVSSRQFTAPPGSVKSRLLEVAGPSTLLNLRIADLGDVLFSIATVHGGALPDVVDTPRGPRVDLAQGTSPTEIQLNSKVRWTVRLTGGSTVQEITMPAAR